MNAKIKRPRKKTLSILIAVSSLAKKRFIHNAIAKKYTKNINIQYEQYPGDAISAMSGLIVSYDLCFVELSSNYNAYQIILNVLKFQKQMKKKTKFIVLSENGNKEVVKKVAKLGVKSYLLYPVEQEKIINSLDLAFNVESCPIECE